MAEDQQDQTRDEAEAQGGGDTAEDKAGKAEEDQEPAGATEDGPQGEEKDEDDMSASEKAQKEEEERDEAKEKMSKLEDDPPEDIEDWPDDKAKYETFGGPEGEHSYHEGPEEQLGPSSLRHHEDGKVSIAGEEVDNPDEYKSEPVPGGPTDEESNDPSSGGETDDDS